MAAHESCEGNPVIGHSFGWGLCCLLMVLILALLQDGPQQDRVCRDLGKECAQCVRSGIGKINFYKRILSLTALRS